MKTIIAIAAAALIGLPAAALAQSQPSTTSKAQGFQGAQDGGTVAPAPRAKLKVASKTRANPLVSPSTTNKAQGFQGAQQ